MSFRSKQELLQQTAPRYQEATVGKTINSPLLTQKMDLVHFW